MSMYIENIKNPQTQTTIPCSHCVIEIEGKKVLFVFYWFSCKGNLKQIREDSTGPVLSFSNQASWGAHKSPTSWIHRKNNGQTHFQLKAFLGVLPPSPVLFGRFWQCWAISLSLPWGLIQPIAGRDRLPASGDCTDQISTGVMCRAQRKSPWFVEEPDPGWKNPFSGLSRCLQQKTWLCSGTLHPFCPLLQSTPENPATASV